MAVELRTGSCAACYPDPGGWLSSCGLAHALHVTLIPVGRWPTRRVFTRQVGNVHGGHSYCIVVSLLYTLLNVVEGILSRLVCGEQKGYFDDSLSAHSKPESEIFCAPDVYFIASPPASIGTDILQRFQSFTMVANVAVLIIYMHLGFHAILRSEMWMKIKNIEREVGEKNKMCESVDEGMRAISDKILVFEASVVDFCRTSLLRMLGLKSKQTEVSFPVMLGGTCLAEVAISWGLCSFLLFRLAPRVRAVEEDALGLMNQVVDVTQRSEVILDLLFGGGGVSATSTETCGLQDLSQAVLPPSEAYTAARAAFTEWLPALRDGTSTIVDWALFGGGVGAAASVLLTYVGIRQTWDTYYRLYPILRREHHACLRMPMRKANSVRLMATLVFYQMMGFLLLTFACVIIGILCALLVRHLESNRRPICNHRHI